MHLQVLFEGQQGLCRCNVKE